MNEVKDLDEPPRGMSGATKVVLGCGLAVALCVVLTCGGAVYGVRFALKKLDSFAEPFEQKGYVRSTGQVIEVRTVVTKPTVYIGQVVKISTDVEADLAIMAQVVEIDGTVKGDIDFFGQVLVLKPGAVVTGDIRVQGAQVVDVSQGTVQGKITGSIQQLKRSPTGAVAPAESPPMLEPPPAPAPPADSPATPAEPAVESPPE